MSVQPYTGGTLHGGPSKEAVPQEETDEKTQEIANVSWKTLGLQFLFSAGLITASITVTAVAISLSIPYMLSLMAAGGAYAVAGPLLFGGGLSLVCGAILSPILLSS